MGRGWRSDGFQYGLRGGHWIAACAALEGYCHAHTDQHQAAQQGPQPSSGGAITDADDAPGPSDGHGAEAGEEYGDDNDLHPFIHLQAGPQPTASLARVAGTGQYTRVKWWNELQQKLKDLFEEYGKVAIWTYVVLWALVLIGYAVAIQLGFEVEGAAATGGVLFAAWVAVKVTQPARIVATLVLTPFVARFFTRETTEALPAE